MTLGEMIKDLTVLSKLAPLDTPVLIAEGAGLDLLIGIDELSLRVDGGFGNGPYITVNEMYDDGEDDEE